MLGRLTAALADRYAIEREPGAGGMATVSLGPDDRDFVMIRDLPGGVNSLVPVEHWCSELKVR